MGRGQGLGVWRSRGPAGLSPPLPGLGPYGERDDQQVFIQKVVPSAGQLFVRLSSTGQR